VMCEKHVLGDRHRRRVPHCVCTDRRGCGGQINRAASQRQPDVSQDRSCS
jgi:hypothetical protein